MAEMKHVGLSNEFLEHLCVKYENSLQGFVSHDDSLWAPIDRLRIDVHTALLSRNLATLRALLLNPMKTKLYYGIDQLYDYGVPVWPDLLTHWRHLSFGAIEAIGRWAGLVREPNPEGGDLLGPGERSAVDLEALLTLIEATTATPMTFPNPFPGELGLTTSRGEATIKAVNAYYQASRLRSINGDGEVVEFGGGMGRTAFYAVQAGVNYYTIVDLPLSLIGQAVFLGLTLGEENISFLGGPTRKTMITLMTPHQFHNSNRRWPFILNVDSMPEMAREQADAYIDRMQSDQSLFMSINHEANRFAVPVIVPSVFRKHRAPYMLRAGYMEEIYDFSFSALGS